MTRPQRRVDGASRHRRSRQRQALTLVEVLCATALAGTLLSAIMIAQGGHLRQIQRARRVTTAVQLLDRMLERWTATRDGLPGDGEYAVPESTDWICRLRRFDTPDARPMLARVVRVELWEAAPSERRATAAASVEMLIADERGRRP